MKKIGCLTFHSSYNYGSSLQAYALKKSVESIDHSLIYSVINFRSINQSELYKSPFCKTDIKSLYSRLFLLKQKNNLNVKNIRFESFISEELNPTECFKNKTDYKDSFDLIITGSDQIWNIRAIDFSWIYFVDLPTNVKRISYACSAGTSKIVFSTSEKEKIKQLLSKYSYISVRDTNTQRLFEDLTQKNIEVCVDPTLLLSDKEWNDLIEKYNVVSVNYDYILFYDLSHKRENWKIAKKMSKILKMPLIITTIPSPRTIDMSLGIKKDYSCGPVEFLSYIKNAKLVLTSSFHGTLFSTIFNIPFFSINSSSDERLSHFLTEFNLINRIIDLNSCCSSAQNYKNINFSTANTKMKEERKRCMEILKKNL